jgi:hypothetical protein
VNKKNSKPQMLNSVNRITVQDISPKLVELSGEELQQVVGGSEPPDLTVQNWHELDRISPLTV